MSIQSLIRHFDKACIRVNYAVTRETLNMAGVSTMGLWLSGPRTGNDMATCFLLSALMMVAGRGAAHLGLSYEYNHLVQTQSLIEKGELPEPKSKRIERAILARALKASLYTQYAGLVFSMVLR